MVYGETARSRTTTATSQIAAPVNHVEAVGRCGIDNRKDFKGLARRWGVSALGSGDDVHRVVGRLDDEGLHGGPELLHRDRLHRSSPVAGKSRGGLDVSHRVQRRVVGADVEGEE